MKKTNFDSYLEEQLRDPDFAERFKRAGEAWDVALQLAALREQAGLSQTELARKLKTTQQQISRLESPGYEGHSLSMLRRVARALNAQVRVIFQAESEIQVHAFQFKMCTMTPPVDGPIMKSAAKRPRQLEAVRRCRGILRSKPGEKPFSEWWADYKREEKQLEEAKYLRWRSKRTRTSSRAIGNSSHWKKKLRSPG
jgi:transcriptional regulator with XRE-family HTH domain